MKKGVKRNFSILLALVMILTVIPFSTFAVSTKNDYKPSLKLSLSTNKSFQKSVTINIKSNSKYGIKNIKIKKGKITSTAKSKWNSAKNITSSKQYKVTENGYYSVLATDKKNNKRLKYIKVSNVSYKKYEGVWKKSELYYDKSDIPKGYEYIIEIKSINRNKIKFMMIYSSFFRLRQSNTINASIKNSKVDFNFTEETYKNKGRGTLLLKDNNVYCTTKNGVYLLANNLKLSRYK